MIRGSALGDQPSMRRARGPRDGCQNRRPPQKPPRQSPLPNMPPAPSPQGRASFTVRLHPSISLPVQFGSTVRRGRDSLSLAAERQPADRSRRRGDRQRARFDVRQWHFTGRSPNLAKSRQVRIRRTFSLCSTATESVTSTTICQGAPHKIGASNEPKSLVRIRATHPVSVTGTSPDGPGKCQRSGAASHPQENRDFCLLAIPSLPGQAPSGFRTAVVA